MSINTGNTPTGQSKTQSNFKNAMSILIVITLFIVVVLVSTAVLSISIPIWFSVFVLFLTVASVFAVSITFSKLEDNIASGNKSDEQ